MKIKSLFLTILCITIMIIIVGILTFGNWSNNSEMSYNESEGITMQQKESTVDEFVGFLPFEVKKKLIEYNVFGLNSNSMRSIIDLEYLDYTSTMGRPQFFYKLTENYVLRCVGSSNLTGENCAGITVKNNKELTSRTIHSTLFPEVWKRLLDDKDIKQEGILLESVVDEEKLTDEIIKHFPAEVKRKIVYYNIFGLGINVSRSIWDLEVLDYPSPLFKFTFRLTEDYVLRVIGDYNSTGEFCIDRIIVKSEKELTSRTIFAEIFPEIWKRLLEDEEIKGIG
jgi:hypothetical protein